MELSFLSLVSIFLTTKFVNSEKAEIYRSKSTRRKRKNLSRLPINPPVFTDLTVGEQLLSTEVNCASE